MRRFEFVEGSSAKFWMAEVSGNTFSVIYGRLGSDGKRLDKPFPSEEAARKEYDKKVAEKLREGYHEVAAGAAASAPEGAKGAAAASAKLELPPRGPAATTDAKKIATATDALTSLAKSAGTKSWAVTRAATRARRAMRALGTMDPKAHKELSASLDQVLALAAVAKGKGARALPLRHVVSLLETLDVSAFEHALTQWKSASDSLTAAVVMRALQEQQKTLGDAELALRLGVLLAVRTDAGSTASEKGVAKRFGREVLPHLEAYLVSKGSRVKHHLQAIETKGDKHLAARVKTLEAVR
ncbi:MAG: WGR domain-containing protein [Deltaproteobacteria bacterium]|nr:WGR domain-containing protein [Deltaproteobacteria bacterium]